MNLLSKFILFCALLLPQQILDARIPRGIESTGSSLPAQVIAAGYTTKTFGPNLTLGGNWFFHSFYGTSTSGATQDGNGISIDGTTTYGITTGTPGAGHSWTGIAFGGGAYFEATLAFPPSASPGAHWPAFWAQDIEAMAPNAYTIATQWPGQASGYGQRVEHDFFEEDFSSTVLYTGAIHHWYNTYSGTEVSTSGSDNGFPFSIGSANFANPNSYGYLWVPATNSTQGYAMWFFNRRQVGLTITWNKYNPSLAPPPVKNASPFSAYAYSDLEHYMPIINTSLVCAPMIVYGMSVYQASSANNITGSLTLSSTSPLPNATHGVAYSQALSFSGGTGPYTGTILAQTGTDTWAATAGTVTGTPVNTGTIYLIIQITDSVGKSIRGVFAITVT